MRCPSPSTQLPTTVLRHAPRSPTQSAQRFLHPHVLLRMRIARRSGPPDAALRGWSFSPRWAAAFTPCSLQRSRGRESVGCAIAFSIMIVSTITRSRLEVLMTLARLAAPIVSANRSSTPASLSRLCQRVRLDGSIGNQSTSVNWGIRLISRNLFTLGGLSISTKIDHRKGISTFSDL